MKKKIRVLGLLVLLFLALTISLVTTSSKLNADGRGQWIYNPDGTHKGCESPGDDCSWFGIFEGQ
jgi:hypothetical protein